jgi:hypothetical protein
MAYEMLVEGLLNRQRGDVHIFNRMCILSDEKRRRLEQGHPFHDNFPDQSFSYQSVVDLRIPSPISSKFNPVQYLQFLSVSEEHLVDFGSSNDGFED